LTRVEAARGTRALAAFGETVMKRAITATLTAVLLAVTTTAHAEPWRGHGGSRHHGGWGGYHHHGHGGGDSDAALVGLGIAGGLIGAAVLAATLASPPAVVAEPVYAEPYRPAYVPSPPPAYEDAYAAGYRDGAARYEMRDVYADDAPAYDTYYGGGRRRR
jgi:hypothetical protein